MSKIIAALQKVEMQRFRTTSPLKIYEAKKAGEETPANTVRQESGRIPFRVCVIAFIISFLAVFALVSSAFTLAKLEEHRDFALDLQMISEAQAAQIKEMSLVQKIQKEDIVLSFNRVEKVAEESHNRFAQVADENSSLRKTIGDLNQKVSLLSAEVSTLKSDNIILTNDQEALHQKLLALKDRVQDIKNMTLTQEPKSIATPQEGI